MECSPALLAQIVAWCRAAAPAEACGFVAGSGRRARRVYPVDNVHPHPERFYTMHPQQQLAALFDMERRGLELLAIFHSHPGGPPEPSPVDVARALWPDALYIIVSVGSGVAEIRAKTEAGGGPGIRNRTELQSESGVRNRTELQSKSGVRNRTGLRSKSGIGDQSGFRGKSRVGDQTGFRGESGVGDQTELRREVGARTGPFAAAGVEMRAFRIDRESGSATPVDIVVR